MKTVQFNWCRLIGFLIIVILVIQIFTMGFLTYVNTDPPKPKAMAGPNQMTNVERAEKVFEAMALRADQDNAVIDSNGEYRLFQNIWFGKKMNKDIVSEDIGVVTHTTVNNMHYLIMMSKKWQGPMSVVIFAPGQDLIIALENILQLVWCVLPMRTYASFHIVSPLNMPARDIKPYINYDQIIECRWMERRMEKTLNINNYGYESIEYPNNLLRNFGIESAMTEYIYVIDVDLVPSANVRPNFLEFARNKHLMFTNIPLKPEKTAFVTPVFESTEDFLIPDNKFLLKRRFNKTLRQFYVEPCPQCQAPTDYERWLNVPYSPFLNSSYSVEWKYPYEPFYIVHRSVPTYNPLFKQYGYNRISQICELHIAGYQFHILNNAFLVHVGYKIKGNFHETKAAEMKKNKILLYKHRDELHLRYPNSTRDCDIK